MRIFIFILSVVLISGCRSSGTFHCGYTGKSEKIKIDAAYIYPQRHSVHIDSAYITGDLLTMRINYSGGCKEHYFNLFSNGKYTLSTPPEVKLFLDDTTRTDNCRQFKEELITFDISGLKHPSQKKVVLKMDDGYNLDYTY
jgi:hypothetical protein